MFDEIQSAAKTLQRYVQRFGEIPRPTPAPPDKQGNGSLKCQSCGGILQNESADSKLKRSLAIARMIKSPPRSKRKPNREWSLKKRIAKKQRKAWAKEVGLIAAIGAPLIGINTLVCAHCGKQDGLYRAVARSIIQIEPMPPGAVAYYNKEIDVTKCIIKEDE
jgi:hypothetical protein